MLGERGSSTVLDRVLPRISSAVRNFLEGLPERPLFHQVVQAAFVCGMAVARVLVEEVSRSLNERIRKTSPHCRNCGRRMERTRDVELQPNTSVGVVSIWRGHYQCTRCVGQTRYPFDEQLGLTGQVCESLTRSIALLGASLPYRMASWTLEQLKGVYVSAKTCHRRTMEVADDLVQRLDAKVKRIFGNPEEHRRISERAPRPYRLYITLDGAMTNIRKEGWKEIRLSALWSESKEAAQEKIRRHRRRLASPKKRRKRKKKRRRRAARGPVSYVVRFRSVEELSRAVYVMALEMGLEKAHEVVVIADGAPWIWKSVVEQCFPDAVCIIDWYHAIQRVWGAASAFYGKGSSKAKAWVRSRKDNLRAGKPTLVVRALQRMRRVKSLSHEDDEVIRLAIGYFSDYGEMMDYQSHLLAGRDIGSGRVEAACKRIVGARLKGTGCRWNLANAEAIAILRAEILSGRLESLWKQRDRDMLNAAVRRSPRQPLRRAG